jgi:hypothetical protein
MSVPSSRHLYDDRLFGERTVATALLEIDGAVFPLRTATKIDVVPAVEIKSITPKPYVWTRATATRSLSFTIELINHQPEAFKGTLAISDNKHIFGTGTKISLDARDTRNIVLGSSVLAGDLSTGSGRKSRTTSHPGALTLSVRNADYGAEITSESVKIAKADAAVARGLRVGYVQSFDQTIEHSLNALGVAATKLDPGEIQTADLKTYSTIIIDNRGYEAHPELIAANEKFLTFVRDGGTLIVFYHKDNEWNPNPNRNRPQLAPYPIILDDSRVTDEHAAVTFLLPTHPLLRFPNRITQADFDDWIQERGLYYPKEWDEHYAALFAMNDPGEKPLKSGLLAASYGKGQYIYTSMVWYRELREGIPGAYRMFANMISYGHR